MKVKLNEEIKNEIRNEELKKNKRLDIFLAA
jgi:hypothetical protein